jgi:hypothetical protein
MMLNERRLTKLAGLRETEVQVESIDDVEERLRETIREELKKLLPKILAHRDEKMLNHAREKKSVGAAMGFVGGLGFGSNPHLTHAPANSRSDYRTLGFKGPGF